jgi:hypothetical protein
MKMLKAFLCVVCLLALAACSKGLPDEAAVKLVRLYNQRVIEAYRTGDSLLANKVAGPKEQTKLLGLIGSKLDMGITLDAEMTEFKALNVEHYKDKGGPKVKVFTEERWYYRDRRIGTGEQVGQDSKDHYFMTYFLGKPEGTWVVEEIRFTGTPEVGRTEVNTHAPAEVFHGEVMTSGTSGDAAHAGASPHPPAEQPQEKKP